MKRASALILLFASFPILAVDIHYPGYMRSDGTYIQPSYQTVPGNNPYNSPYENPGKRGNANTYSGTQSGTQAYPPMATQPYQPVQPAQPMPSAPSAQPAQPTQPSQR